MRKVTHCLHRNQYTHTHRIFPANLCKIGNSGEADLKKKIECSSLYVKSDVSVINPYTGTFRKRTIQRCVWGFHVFYVFDGKHIPVTSSDREVSSFTYELA